MTGAVAPRGSRHLDGPKKILLSGVSSDAHMWNLIYLQLFIEESGHHVRNLGPCAPDELILEHCVTWRPDALVISTVNGHGHLDGVRLIRTLREAGGPLATLPAVIGGKLGIHGIGNARFHQKLLDAGFDAVFGAEAGIMEFQRYLTMLGRNGHAVETTTVTAC
ncbi:cobalamin B12-binding domain-containing protein [Streptomyces sp. NPDC057623]|uniref:cobalamin B12-binding domain-containing protein n=1 Tax=Streptomyces sp. NPDC057623 TaxID=3346187 RepID=UPI003684DF51